MHTRAEWKVLPFRQPARGAAARSASLDLRRERGPRCEPRTVDNYSGMICLIEEEKIENGTDRIGIGVSEKE